MNLCLPIGHGPWTRHQNSRLMPYSNSADLKYGPDIAQLTVVLMMFGLAGGMDADQHKNLIFCFHTSNDFLRSDVSKLLGRVQVHNPQFFW